MRKLLLAASLALSAPLLMGATPPNWLATVAETSGGHRMGNPEAKVKLIEFVSYTCPHCAHFEQQSEGALKLAYVSPGKVSVEVRHYLRDPVDLTVATITNCVADEKFFGLHTAFLVTQETWLAKAREMTAAQQQRWSTGPIPARLRAVASDLDFYDMLEARGIGRTTVDQCFTDEAAVRALVDKTNADRQKWDIPGTPSFAINGTMVPDVHTWQLLQKSIDAAL